MRRAAILFLIIGVTVSFARSKQSPQGHRNWDIKPIKINDLWMWNSNFGEFGQQEGDNPGGEWPGGSGHMYNFGSGIWVGCLIEREGRVDTLVSMGYNPNSGRGEMVPGLIEMGSAAQTDPEVVVYEYPGLWPPPESKFPMAPQENFSLADQWMCFNDGDPAFHDPNDTEPIGLEFYLSVYGWNYESNKDIVFYRWVIKNVSGESLKNVQLGICVDPDVGYHADDIVRLFLDTVFTEVQNNETIYYHVDNVGFCYDFDGDEGWDSVGCIAYDYLQSPYALHDGKDNDREKDSVYKLPPTDSLYDEAEADSALFTAIVTDPKLWDGDGDGIMDWRDPSMIEQFGMTAFIRFTLEIDPSWDPERYVTMVGYDYRTMDSIGYMRDDNEPDDKRFIQCTGPFSMGDGDTVVCVASVICAGFHHPPPHQEPADSMHLVRRDAVAQFIFDMNWLLPGPPPSPTVKAIPGDHQVTLVWDDLSERTPDPYFQLAGNPTSTAYDSFYVEYDFQGYKVYRSLTGEAADWILLGQCDISDSVTAEAYPLWEEEPESVRTNPTNSGLFHSFIDTTPRNGFTYYYAVTAYDFNAVTEEESLKRHISLESGKAAVAVSPRREAANYIPPTCSITTVNVPEYAATELIVGLPDPMEVKESEYLLKFYLPTPVEDTLPAYNYSLWQDGKRVVPAETLPYDSVGIPIALGDSAKVGFPIIDGVELGFKTKTASFRGDMAFPTEKIKVLSGNYPEDSLRGYSTSSTYNNRWAFTGADYGLKWKSTPEGFTLEVTDLNTGELIPYKPFNPRHDTLRDSAYSWCFLTSLGIPGRWSRYLKADSTTFLHVTGGFIRFKPSGSITQELISMLSDGDEWKLGSRAAPIVPYNCEYHIYSIPAKFSTKKMTLNVKVVPNPYIVTNEWQITSIERKLKFINLPNRCTIRIFTVAGDLIKTIKHEETYQQPNDAGGDEWWDILTDNDQIPASGVYLFHVESDIGEQVGKFVILIGKGVK